MRRSLALARRGMGRTWPNPPVGCVLVRENLVIAAARTADGGRPHAESLALEAAGDAARGATAYVSLEPCAHHGRTPPCADALASAGVQRCVVACEDPDSRVAGRGVTRLRAAGIEAVTGVLAREAGEIVAGHCARVHRRRPWLTLKVAASLDGAVAGADRTRTTVTGRRARAFVESLRAERDSVLVGIGTAMADDPMLAPDNPGLRRRAPVRIVLDRRLRLDPGSRLARSARQIPTWALHAPLAPESRRRRLSTAGVRLIEAARSDAGLGPALARLAECGVTSVLCEAGPTLCAAVLQEDLADEVIWLAAGRTFGTCGLPAVAGAFRRRYELTDSLHLGDDIATIWRPTA